MKPGEFQKQKERNKIRQRIFDACKRAREGEDDVWITVSSGEARQVRVKLAPVDPVDGDFYDYACNAGYGAIILIRGVPSFVLLEGREGQVYLPTGSMDARAFAKKVLALVQRYEDVKAR